MSVIHLYLFMMMQSHWTLGCDCSWYRCIISQ